MEQAIDLYTWTTPNGYKISILSEELGWTYNVIPVNIGKGEQFAPEFIKISPNNKIPAIVDRDTANGQPYAVFESGAILMYLAEKAGRFLNGAQRIRADRRRRRSAPDRPGGLEGSAFARLGKLCFPRASVPKGTGDALRLVCIAFSPLN